MLMRSDPFRGLDDLLAQQVAGTIARREWAAAENAEMIASERPSGTFSRQLFLSESPGADHIDTPAPRSAAPSR